MKPYMTKTFPFDVPGAKTLALLSATWAPGTTLTYGNIMHHYFDLCDEYRLAPLAATPARMVRYVAWLGKLGTIKVSSIQPQFSAVYGFFKDHGLEASALGDLVAEVKKGLAALQVAIDATTVRIHLPTSVVVQALSKTQALRLQLSESPTRAALHIIPAREQVRLLRACTIVVIFNLFFGRGGSSVD
jgi:hypothetical protein